MEKLSFFTPIVYEEHSFKHAITNFIEEFCSFGHRKAYVIHGQTSAINQEVVLYKRKLSLREKVIHVAIKIFYLTLVFPLLAWTTKALFRAGHTFRVASSPSLFQNRNSQLLPTKKSVIESLQPLFTPILEGHDVKDLKSSPLRMINFQKNGDKINSFFLLSAIPNVIFHLNSDDRQLNQFYRSAKYAESVRKIYNLNLLVVPKIEMLTVEHQKKKYSILALEKLESSTNMETMTQGGPNRSELDEAIKQLALFTCKTGYNPNWKKIPLLKNRKLGIVNMSRGLQPENFLSADRLTSRKQYAFYKKPLFGNNAEDKGLLGIANKKQAQEIIAIAKKELNWSKEFDRSAKAALYQFPEITS